MKHFEQYAKLIKDGYIPANEYIKLAIKRVERFQKEYEFRQGEADKRIAFIESECSNTKGERGPLKLALPQKVKLEVAWGFYHNVTVTKTDPDTMQKYTISESRRLIHEVPIQDSRGVGKTTLAAAIGNVGQIADGEYGADVQLLAITREQTGYLYNANTAMLNYEPSLLYALKQKELLHGTKKGLMYEPTNSLLTIKTSDYETLDGTNGHYNIFDEVHGYKEDFIDVVNTGSKRKRKNWMSWYLTSGGVVRDMVFDRYKAIWVNILKGVIDDDSVMPWLHQLDNISEVSNPRLWGKAVSMLGVNVEEETIAADIEVAKNDPVKQAELLAKTFGIPIGNYQAYFTNEECDSRPDLFRPDLFQGVISTVKKDDGSTEEVLERSARVIIGIDLSDVNDICSISFMVPDGENRHFISKKYMPRSTLDKLPKEQFDKYLEWETSGHLHVHEMDYNKPKYIFEDLLEFIHENHMLPVAVGYDPWGIAEMKQLFEDHYGDICHPIPQTVKGLSNLLKVYKSKIGAEQCRILFDDPVATWCHMNVNVKIDGNKNIFPNKQKAKNKIDVFASMLDAFICYENEKENLAYYFDD